MFNTKTQHKKTRENFDKTNIKKYNIHNNTSNFITQIKNMVYNETNEYNNTGENNNLWDNLRNLINQIDELKDDNKDNDELIWIFEQWNRALNDWL